MKLFLILILLTLMAFFTYTACNPTVDLSGTSSTTGSGTTKRIFVTANTFNGSFGSVAAADTLCGVDANKPGAGTYKAMIVDTGGTRTASVSPNVGDGQGNWVLAANTTYIRTDGTVIFTTNANALFVFGTMTNAISTAFFNVWTGLNSDWTTAANTCTDWTSAVSNGNSGWANYTDNQSMIAGTNACGGSFALYCVEQ